MNAAMLSRKICQFDAPAVQEQQRARPRSAPRAAPVSSTLTRRRARSSVRCSDGQSTRSTVASSAVGVRGVRAGRRTALCTTAAICARAAPRRATVSTACREHRDRHRLHAAPLLGSALRRRPAPLRHRAALRGPGHVGDRRCCGPSRSAPASGRRTPRSGCSPPSPIPGASTSRGGRRGRPLHPHHVAPDRVPRRDAAVAARIELPYDELYCSYDKVARCREIGIDVLIDDSPVNLEAALDAGITAATILHPGTASCARRRT